MPRKTAKKQRAEATKAPVKTEETRTFKREMHRRSNAEIAEEVAAGIYGTEWRYAVRKLGYRVKAIEALLKWI